MHNLHRPEAADEVAVKAESPKHAGLVTPGTGNRIPCTVKALDHLLLATMEALLNSWCSLLEWLEVAPRDLLCCDDAAKQLS